MVQDATPMGLRKENKEKKDKKTGFYNIQDGQKGRDGGPYLDHQERQQAEVIRAFREEREPEDLNGPLPAAQGTMLVTAPLVPDNPYSNPSMAAAPGLMEVVDDSTFADSDNLADPISVLPVDTRTTDPEGETLGEPDSGDPYKISDGDGNSFVPAKDHPVVAQSNKTDADTKAEPPKDK